MVHDKVLDAKMEALFDKLNAGGLSKEQREDIVSRLLALAEQYPHGEQVETQRKRKCPVCGKTYFEDWYDICKECGWEHDNVQESEPDFDAGPNDISLNEYRKKYLAGWRPEWLDSLDDE